MGLTVTDIYPSTYLTAEDLGGKRVRVQISEVSQAEVPDFNDKSKKVTRLMLGFKDKQKKLLLGKRNAMVLKTKLGNECFDWMDKEIEVYAEPESVGGVTKDVLKVTLPQEVANSGDAPGF